MASDHYAEIEAKVKSPKSSEAEYYTHQRQFKSSTGPDKMVYMLGNKLGQVTSKSSGKPQVNLCTCPSLFQRIKYILLHLKGVVWGALKCCIKVFFMHKILHMRMEISLTRICEITRNQEICAQAQIGSACGSCSNNLVFCGILLHSIVSYERDCLSHSLP